MEDKSEFLRGLKLLPYDLWEERAKLYLTGQKAKVKDETARFTRSATQDGDPTAVTLENRTQILQWVAAVSEYFSHRTPRCRPSVHLPQLDRNTRFWVMHSPFQFLQTLDITVTSPVWFDDMTEAEVAGLGSHLGWIPLQHITLRARAVDPLFNGLVQWPRLPHVTEVELHFTRGGPPNEWKRPFFPQALRSFTNLESLELRIERAGDRRSGLADPHLLFASYSRGVPYIRRPAGETIDATLKRVATNVSFVCPSLERIVWAERHRPATPGPSGWLTEELAYRRNWETLHWQ